MKRAGQIDCRVVAANPAFFERSLVPAELLGRWMRDAALDQSKITRPVEANLNREIRPVQRPTRGTRTWDMPGILGSTRVVTDFGHVPAHLVRVGDSLKTRRGGYLRVLRRSEFKLDQDFLARRPDAVPVMIRKGSLRPHVPLQDVCVSPAQRVSITFDRMDACAVPATEVTQLRAIIDRSLGHLTYYRFHLAEKAQINCDGVWVEAGV